MQPASFTIRKPLFFLLNAALLLLLACVVFLYHDKKEVEVQNRQLIIQNDSVMSVNIVLTDSVKKEQLQIHK